jgi:predicted SprT family Zn-dependent metalloprotease
MEAIIEKQKEFYYVEGESTNLEDFDALFEELFSRDWVYKGKTYNLPKLGWTREYCNATSKLGDCWYYRRTKLGKVRISMTLLKKNLDKGASFEDVVRHEIAHAIQYILRGTSNHGWEWKDIAMTVGANPTRIHEGEIAKPKGKYSAKCPKCGTVHQAQRKRTRDSWCKCTGRTFKQEEKLVFKPNY